MDLKKIQYGNTEYHGVLTAMMVAMLRCVYTVASPWCFSGRSSASSPRIYGVIVPPSHKVCAPLALYNGLRFLPERSKAYGYHREFAKKKIRINSISPGNILFKRSIWEKKLISNKRKTINYINKQVPMKSFIYPKNIYDLVKFIIDYNNKLITGSNFVIDGGQTKNF